MDSIYFTKKSIIVKYFKKEYLIVTVAFCFGLLDIFSIILIPIFIGKYYQLAMNTNSERGKIFTSLFGEVNDIYTFLFLFISLLTTKLIFSYFKSLLIGIVSERFSKSLRESLFESQLFTELKVFEKKKTGNYLLRYSGDLGAITKYLTKGIIGFINDLIFLSLTLLFFLSINVQLSLIIVVSIIVLFLGFFLMNLLLKRFTSLQRDLKSQNLGFVSARLNAISTIKSLNRETIEVNKYIKKSEKLYNASVNYHKLHSLIDNLSPFFLYLMLSAVLATAYFINHSENSTIDGAQILIFIMMTINIIPVFKRIIKVHLIWQSGDISFQKMLALLNVSIEKNKEVINSNIKYPTILFDNVTYFMDDKSVLFNNLSFEISQPGIYRIKGEQGSGKSTLFKILLGLYKIDLGKIEIGSININEINPSILRKHITISSDELSLLGDTLFEVVSYSR
ncbi:MAG: ABC transporter ATP-binding protein, partial [Crocinitomicaceae bacterium]|nr:ABC transporter ATP-binding protein [Crocinitomicaceae bacterium]